VADRQTDKQITLLRP